MFTVIVTTHDRPLLLQRTLRSLIAQTWQDFKVIVVSDSATYLPPYAEMQALAGRYTYIIRSGEPGPARSRDTGVALCDTPYLMFLDDDDTYEPQHLATLAAAIGAGRPELVLCDFQVRHEDRTVNPPLELASEPISLAALRVQDVYVLNRIPNSCVAYRADVARGATHDASLRIYEDWDFLLGCLRGRQLSYVPTASVVIHKSAANAPENLRRGNTRDDLIAE
ncbi:MAG TPA: glycosyltransferase family 2 protein, partial [Telluria sp.]|nr:glycosyltransferase family 2 protein [Telluria sp.]